MSQEVMGATGVGGGRGENKKMCIHIIFTRQDHDIHVCFLKTEFKYEFIDCICNGTTHKNNKNEKHAYLLHVVTQHK